MNYNILFLDDNVDYGELILAVLGERGYSVHVATTLSQAVHILSSQAIDLIITDVRLKEDLPEDQSGIEFAKTVGRTIPKIIYTAYPQYTSIREVLSASNNSLPIAIDYVTKQAGLEELVQAVEAALSGRDFGLVSEFKAGGALTSEDAAIYTPRDAEQKVVTYLKQNHYILIVEPRQQGKTSLINFLRRTKLLDDSLVLSIDISSLSTDIEKQWYQKLCFLLNRQLQFALSKTTVHLPEDSFGWREYLFEVAGLGNELGKQIIITFDEIGSVDIPNSERFFTVLRDVHNARDAETEFNSLTFLLAGSFHPKNLINNERISPFNVAQRVRLRDFDLAEITHLSRPILLADERRREIVERVFNWTHGQPYLTHKLLSLLDRFSTATTVDEVALSLIRDDENHLPSIVKRITDSKILHSSLSKIYNGETIWFSPNTNPIVEDLELIGVICSDENGNCKIKNRIYQTLFVRGGIIKSV